MAYDRITRRCRQSICEAIEALALPGVTTAAIVVRNTPAAKDLPSPAIVVSPGRVERRPSPAGLRVREVVSIVSIYAQLDGTGAIDDDVMENWKETIAAAFDYPPTMPSAVTSGVVEACECRIRSAEAYLPAAYRYMVAAHRLAVGIEVWQQAGVVA